MVSNSNLNNAKAGKNDEFYTKLYDVVMGLNRARHLFKGKDILCPCADMGRAFHKYFAMNLIPFQLRSLTVFSRTGRVMRYYGKKKEVIFNGCSGSFTDNSYLTPNTLIVTNPPFSLLKQFVKNYSSHPFIILGPINATAYRPVVPLIINGTMQIRHYIPREYRVPYQTEKLFSDGYYQRLGNTAWFYHKCPPIPFSQLPPHIPSNPPLLDDYNALFCNSIMDIFPSNIPLAVPMTYLCYHNPAEWKIIDYLHEPHLHGRKKFKRWIIEKIR